MPLSQEGHDDVEGFGEAPDEVVGRIAEGAELGIVIAGAEAEDEPAVADAVDRVGRLGQEGRVAEVGAGDEGTQLDPLGGLGQGGQ